MTRSSRSIIAWLVLLIGLAACQRDPAPPPPTAVVSCSDGARRADVSGNVFLVHTTVVGEARAPAPVPVIAPVRAKPRVRPRPPEVRPPVPVAVRLAATPCPPAAAPAAAPAPTPAPTLISVDPAWPPPDLRHREPRGHHREPRGHRPFPAWHREASPEREAPEREAPEREARAWRGPRDLPVGAGD